MTLELAAIATIMLTIIGSAIALAAVIVPGQRAMRQEIGGVRREIGDVRQEIGDVRQEIGTIRQEIGTIRQEMGEMRRDIGDLRERMARIEGLFEGFTRSAPATPAAPSPQPQP